MIKNTKIQKSKNKNIDPAFNKMFLVAKKYLGKAYSPYSKVKVASAVLFSDGTIFGGCNIENASYGGTICAERVAITKGVSEGGKKIKSILVVTNQNDIWPPCGLCRQVISEFSSPDTTVYCCDLKGRSIKQKFSALFPGAFDKRFLNT